MTPWTFETLAAADRGKLEEVLEGGTPPEFDQLEGYIYCGWNHEWVGRLSGEKFKKGFRRRDGHAFGYNEVCHQDRQGYRGEWKVKLQATGARSSWATSACRTSATSRRSRSIAATRTPATSTTTSTSTPASSSRCASSATSSCCRTRATTACMLAKAYFQFGFDWLNVFYCYFLLGHRQAIEHEPW